ncbi:hypothetical protein BZM27_47955 [Paraburkholderia steynii]|uniref:Uncharacterized protein n=1 Tax=Paraburkholderia steynii TaxID=1245441 RepID=A0A4R0X9H0_9BURK|nr:hypothetical protein BZM27_47955 [Paraburkholderia steynii]
MRHISARPEQSSFPNTLTERHPLFSYAGRCAADLWLQGAPLSMADFRDLRFRCLVSGDTSFAGDPARRQAFDDAFARQIASSIASRSRVEGRRHA